MGMATSKAMWSVPYPGGRPVGVPFAQIGGSDIIAPECVELRVYGARGGPDYTVTFRIREGIPEVAGVIIAANPKGRGLRRADLAELGNPADLAQLAFTLFARRVVPGKIVDNVAQGPVDPFQDARQVIDWGTDLQGRGIVVHMRLGEPFNVLESRGLPTIQINVESSSKAGADRQQATNRAINAGYSRSREVTLAELEQVAEVYRQNIDNNPTEAVRRHFGYSARTASRRVNQAREKGLLSRTTQGRKQA